MVCLWLKGRQNLCAGRETVDDSTSAGQASHPQVRGPVDGLRHVVLLNPLPPRQRVDDHHRQALHFCLQVMKPGSGHQQRSKARIERSMVGATTTGRPGVHQASPRRMRFLATRDLSARSTALRVHK